MHMMYFDSVAIKDKQTAGDNVDLPGNEHECTISAAQIEECLLSFVSFTDPLPFHNVLHVFIKLT